MKKQAREALQGYLLIAPLLLGCLLFYAIPFGMVCWYSLRSSASRRSSFVGLENYRALLENELFRTAAANTLCFLLAALPAILLLAYGIALLLRQRAERYRLLKAVLLLPYVMPVVGTVLLVELFLPDNRQGLVPVIVLYLWKNTGYSVLLLLAGLMTIPREQYAAASLDGAGALQKFFYITTPQMWHAVFFCLLFSLLNAFKCFREIFLIAGKHLESGLYMLQHFINNSFESLSYTRLSAASVLLFAAVTAVLGVFYAWIRRKEGAA